MNKCLCCNKELKDNNNLWHKSCIKKFFNTQNLPIVDLKNYKYIYLNSENKNSIITGVQKKLSLNLEKHNGQSRLTLLNYPSGYILKINNQTYPFICENEYLTMHLAKLCNIETVPFGLIPLEDNSFAYITKRIDRKKNKKIAMEDFCQLGERLTEQKYNSSYEKVGKIINKYSDNRGLDYYKIFNIILFSFIVGNSDMHLKNFSLYKNKGKYQLTPSYDLINSIIITNDDEELALSIDGKKCKLKKINFINLANKYYLSQIQTNKIFDNFEKKYALIIETISQSLLDEEYKEKYTSIINNRYDRLFN